MIQPKRLFDAVAYQQEKFPKPDMLACKIDGNWKPFSTAAVAENALRLAAGLVDLGVSGNDFTPEGADKVAIISIDAVTVAA